MKNALKYEDYINAEIIKRKIKGFAFIKSIPQFDYAVGWEKDKPYYHIVIGDENNRVVTFIRPILEFGDLTRVLDEYLKGRE